LSELGFLGLNINFKKTYYSNSDKKGRPRFERGLPIKINQKYLNP
jgi:hypothetical protein